MNRIKNGIGLRREMEENYQIGLNAFGTFVMASLDKDELDHLTTVSFKTMQWSDEYYALEVNGTAKRGSLVTIAKLSSDGRYCYRSGAFRYLSPRLLQADPESISDFLSRIQNNKTLRISQARNRREYIGILVGDIAAQYKSLIVLQHDRITAEKIEENPPPQSRKDKTTILEEDPPEGKEVLRRLVELYC